MSDSVKKTIEHIRQQIVANIRAGPMPPQEEMPLLSQEYQAVWRAEEEPGDAALLARTVRETRGNCNHRLHLSPI